MLRGTYKQLAAKGLVSWETAQDIAAVKAPGVQKNSTPSLTQRQAIALLEAIPSDTLQGIRDLALMSVFFLTGCRVSAVTGACVGHLETDGVEHYLHVTEKRNKKRRKILLDAARPVLAYVARAGIGEDKEGPLFRPDDAGRAAAGAAAPGPQDSLAAGQEILPGGRHRPRRGWAAEASASTRCARRRSTTRSGTGRPCTRCGRVCRARDIRTTEVYFVGRRKTPRWRHGGSRSASRGLGSNEGVLPRIAETTCFSSSHP